jgi:aspartyl-tRNA(Asn)/glutamyl-tRNA(Gln) amidotransferase subunit B
MLLRYLGASEANMEKGQMRVEANISVARKGERSSAYVEIKNLNSFRAMERAVDYEIKRQEGMLDRGEILIKQTLGWDENKQVTFPQRNKEGSADYRYFPDPDLPSLKLSEIPQYRADFLQKTMPELPSERRDRYIRAGIKAADADMYVRDTMLGDFFEAVTSDYREESKIQLASNYIANDLVKILRDFSEGNGQISQVKQSNHMPISVANFKKIIEMVTENKISSRSAKDLLGISISDLRNPEEIASEKGLFQVTSTADLGSTIEKIVSDNQTVVADYKAGKGAALEYLVGQAMKALRGAADPNSLRDMFKEYIV